jgi:hypothetical protein
MSRWLKNYGFAFLVLAGLTGSSYLGATVAVPDPAPDFALQADEIYRLEVGAAFFVAFYLATMAVVLALDGRGFAELGTRGLRAERVVHRSARKQQQSIHRQTAIDRLTRRQLEEHEQRLEELERKSLV